MVTAPARGPRAAITPAPPARLIQPGGEPAKPASPHGRLQARDQFTAYPDSIR